MPLRQFPLPVNVGVDIVSVERIRNILDKGHDNFRRYLRRFLTQHEQSKILRRYGDADLTDRRAIDNISRLLAGRWAAKEATIKAVTWRRLTFHDIIIRRAQPPNGYVHAIILDSPVTGDGHTDSARSPKDLRVDQQETVNNTSLEEPPSSDSLYRRSEVSSEIDLEIHEEKSSALQPRREVESTQDQGLDDDGTFQNLSGQVAQISISHDGGYATAVCLAAHEPMDGDVGGELAARSF